MIIIINATSKWVWFQFPLLTSNVINSLLPEYFFQSDFPLASAPPPYSIATSLPTYDEAEKAAAMATSVANMVHCRYHFGEGYENMHM